MESEQHRTTDPVRMYMREMGSVELLTREGEIEIAKRIEEGTRELMSAVSDWPTTVAAVIAEWDRVVAGERKLTDVISGYLNPMEHVPSALAQQQAAEAAEARKNCQRRSSGRRRRGRSRHEGGLDPEEPQRVSKKSVQQLKKTDASMCALRPRPVNASSKNLTGAG